MSPAAELRTDRLILRGWRPSDREPFATMNGDPEVMELFPSTLSREESDALADRIETHMENEGWGLWAVEIPGVTSFAGFVGLLRADDVLPTPAVEIGWRLARPYWDRGYATEGAYTSLRYGFEQLGLEEIVSFTAVQNARSRRVMEKIGMTHDPTDDFDHPRVPDGSPLKRHVLYRISRPGGGARHSPVLRNESATKA